MPAAFEFNEIEIFCGRYKALLASLYDRQADDTFDPVAIAAADIVRAKLSATEGGVPVLDLSSDPGEVLAGGSTIEIVTLGSVGNPDPEDDVPAQVRIIFDHDDTEGLADAWAATVQRKHYWLDLMLDDDSDGHRKPFGRGRVLVHRSPAGL